MSNHTDSIFVPPLKALSRVKFYVAGTEDNENHSYSVVTHKGLFRDNEPEPGGIYDAHMGTTDHEWKCSTCCNTKDLCPGHAGSFNLNYPVLHPMMLREIKRWLKLICHTCGKSTVPIPALVNGVPRGDKFMNSLVQLAKGGKQCPHCKAKHPTVMTDPENPTWFLYADIGEKEKVSAAKKRDRAKPLYPHVIGDILNRVSNETVINLGKSIKSHPRKFVLWTIAIPPNTVRPDIRKFSGNRSNSDDITAAIKMIYETNERIRPDIPDVIDDSLESHIKVLNIKYYSMVRANTNPNAPQSNKLRIVGTKGQFSSLASRQTTKQGRIRRNLMARRAFVSMRSTITCDPALRIDELGVPKEIATNIQFPETVRPENKARLMTYFLNGRTKYPGCTKIESARDGATYLASQYKGVLEYGDVIWRDMITGDVLNFNRNPSLLYSNISCHHIRVLDTGSTFRLNVSACNMYNADFDGD